MNLDDLEVVLILRQVEEVRERTGASTGDCKHALAMADRNSDEDAQVEEAVGLIRAWLEDGLSIFQLACEVRHLRRQVFDMFKVMGALEDKHKNRYVF